MRKQIHLLVSGLVQGVFFRASASYEARRLNLVGFAGNLPNGAVEVVAEGEEEALRKMADWCRKGPIGARVESVEISWNETTGQFNDFRTR